jgi:DNA-binding MarR family transcriptional regulator
MTTPKIEEPETHQRLNAIRGIGATMARMRLMIGRRYIGRLAIRKMGSGMELSHLDVISLVNRLSKSQDVTVGAIAENMHIDHSRASRVAADLVKRGVLMRDVSQEDARRTIVVLTDEGKRLVSEVHDVKHEVLGKALADWPEADIVAFAELYARFTAAMEAQARQAAGDAEDAA